MELSEEFAELVAEKVIRKMRADIPNAINNPTLSAVEWVTREDPVAAKIIERIALDLGGTKHWDKQSRLNHVVASVVQLTRGF